MQCLLHADMYTTDNKEVRSMFAFFLKFKQPELSLQKIDVAGAAAA